MDFISRIPRSEKGHDSIWVIVDDWPNLHILFPLELTIAHINMLRYM
jgi:hypothetical protein